MIPAAAKAVVALAMLLQAEAAAPPPSAVPFDCSWIHHPPAGARERFEGVWFSFIDDSGFVACASERACQKWIGKPAEELAFSPRASARLRERSPDLYGVYRIAFEGRRGKLGTRAGCEDGRWTLDSPKQDYVRVERILSMRRLERPSNPRQERSASPN